MKFIITSLIIGTLLGLIIRYDLSQDNFSNNGQYSVFISRNKKIEMYTFSQISKTNLNTNSTFSIYVKFFKNKNLFNKIDDYIKNLYNLTGIYANNSQLMHRSIIYKYLYSKYHMYTFFGSDLLRKNIIINDFYHILNNSHYDINHYDIYHYQFTPLELWSIKTSNQTLYPECQQCSYDIILINKNTKNLMLYSKNIYNRTEYSSYTFRELNKYNNYHKLFEDDNISLYMSFGNGKWHLNNDDCQKHLIKIYTDQICNLI